jgi:hypothetical protein
MARIIISILLIFIGFQSHSQIAMFHAHNQMPNSLLLDVAGANSITAYSLRKLRSAYTGPLVQVTHAIDGVLLDIYPDATGHLDTNALKTFAGSGDSHISRWYDQSGNGRHTNVTVKDTLVTPKVMIAGVIVRINGKPSAYFFGTSGSFSCQLFANFTAIPTTAQSTFIIFNQNPTNAFARVVSQSVSGFRDFESGIIPLLRSGSTNTWGSFDQSAVVATKTVNANTTYVWSMIHTGSQFKNSLNNDTEATSSHTLNTSPIQYSLGGGSSSSGVGAGGIMVGYISEAIWYSADKSSDKSAILSNINSYYTIY